MLLLFRLKEEIPLPMKKIRFGRGKEIVGHFTGSCEGIFIAPSPWMGEGRERV
jgi:hypothetical protein